MLFSGSADASDAEDLPLQAIEANQGRKQPDVIRKVNSGFEILRPGTLGTPAQNSERDSFIGSSAKRPPRRLHKKSISGSAGP